MDAGWNLDLGWRRDAMPNEELKSSVVVAANPHRIFVVAARILSTVCISSTRKAAIAITSMPDSESLKLPQRASRTCVVAA